ncbi:unnamed protein product, partial [Mesorhabditis belari]|uniref:BHLH domain-containing protein n=1 Tax=Mesorhabditis belari TaxID=2138241 RepID=A0AAF3E9W6_9BILA
MECPPYDMSIVDPFSVLEEDLNDVSEVIRSNGIWTGMESGIEAMHWQSAPSNTHHTQTHWVMPEDGGRQLTPPGVYYHDQKNREIGSIVSLLQSDSPPRDQHNPHFSPPHFHRDPMWGGSGVNQQPQTYTYSMQNELLPPVGRMLPELSGSIPSPSSHTLVEIGVPQTSSQHGLAHHLSMPAMQPPPSPLSIEPLSLSSPIAPEMGSPRIDEPIIDQINQMVPSPPMVFGSVISSPNTQKVRRERKPLLLVKSEPKEFVMPNEEGSKEILVKLLESNNIRTIKSPMGCETKPRPSGVALRVASSSGGLLAGPNFLQSLPRATSAPSFDDEDDDEDDDMGDDDLPPPTKKGPKTERRTAHNLIEKKYRCSINDRIQQMKAMLAGDEAKLSKSATLRRGIEHIEMQDRAIRELQSEVHFLRNLLAQNNVEVPPLSISIEDPIGSPLSGNTTRSSSRVASPHTSPLSSPKSGKRARARDESRLGLFAVMLAVLFFNPLSLVSLSGWASAEDTQSYTPDHHSRVLRSADYGDDAPFEAYQSVDEWYTSSFVRGIFIWTVNAFVVICILTRLLVYGEPVQDLKSRTWTEFVAVRNKARESLEKGLLREAQRNLVDALSILDRPLPSAGIETIVSITWQVIRHLLNSMWIGRWLARRGRNAEKPQTVVCRSHAHTALVYHKLHQLYLLSPEAFPSRFCSLHLSLSAVNLAESAGSGRDGIPRAIQAAIYLGAALSVRLTLPRYLSSMMALYFIKRAKRQLRRADQNTVSGLAWTVHPIARRFLSEEDRVKTILTTRNFDSRPFVAPTDPGNALGRLRDAFKTHLVKMLLDELQSETTPKIDVADISQLLLSICTEGPQTAEIDKMFADPFLKTVTTGDPMCLWWTHVLSCALYWRAGDTNRAKTHYTLVRQCPSQLLDDQLALAVGHAFCSRKLCIDNRDNKNFAPLAALHSRKALEALRTVVARPAMPQVSHIQESFRQLSYEWILSSVLDGWRGCLDLKNPYWLSRQNVEFKTLYQEAYNHYQFIADQQKSAELKCSIYRMTCRMLNGANPIHTFTCLQRLRREIQNRDATRIPFRREDAPDRYHMHVLGKLHSDINSIAAKRR